MTFTYEREFDADLELQFAKLSSRSFSFDLRIWNSARDRIGRQNLRLLLDKKRLVGGLGFYRMAQWYGGKCLSTAGVALVNIGPEFRGKKASTCLLRELLNELHDDGFALASLYPSTQPVYRKVGFEQAGHVCQFEIDARAIGNLNAELEVVTATAADQTVLDQLATERARESNGNLERTAGLWDRLCNPREYDCTASCFLVRSNDQIEGYVIYIPAGGANFGSWHLSVRDIAYRTREAAETIWSFLASHRSTHKTIQWFGPYTDPLLCLTAEDDAKLVHRMRWMNRIVHLEKALTERGYPTGLRLQLELEVSDPLIANNNGRFTLELRDGKGTLTSGGIGKLKLDISTLSSLFTSFLPASTFARLGKLQADEEEIEKADLIFSGPEPWMPDKF